MKENLVLAAITVALIGAVYAQKEQVDEQRQNVITLHQSLRTGQYDRALEVMPLVKDIDIVSLPDQHGSSAPALSLAAQDSMADGYDMAKALVEKYGADTNIRDNWGFTPLHHAAISGNLAVVDLLVRYGAEVNAEVEGDNHHSGSTPLHMAIRFGRTRVADALRAYGARGLSREEQEDLEKDASLHQELVDTVKSLGDMDDPNDIVRTLHRQVSQNVIETFDRMGRSEMADAWREFSPERVESLLAQNPAPQDGSDTSEWAARVLGLINAEIEGGLSQ